MIIEDDDLYLLHHYLQKGHTLESLLALLPSDRLFLQASMILFYEEEAERWKVN
jgi:hypothetical protein